MNISLLEPLGVPASMIDELAEPIRKAGHNFTYYDNKTTDVEELKRRSAGQDIIMIANNKYPSDVVDSAHDLKMLAVAFTGIDHVGLGSDFDGIAVTPEGMEDAGCFSRIFDELYSRGYSQEDVEKIAGGNFLRVWDSCLASAAARI